jgi:hypothetical protein
MTHPVKPADVRKSPNTAINRFDGGITVLRLAAPAEGL